MDICFQIVCFDCGNDAAVNSTVRVPKYPRGSCPEFSTNLSLSPGLTEGQMCLRSVAEVQ